MDSFKIVCTKERKGLFYTAVPHQWEANNVLYYPNHLTRKDLEKERSNGASVPLSNWAQFQCTVKCSRIEDFETALSIEENFSKCVDTDAEDEYLTLLGSPMSMKVPQCFENRNNQMLLAMEKNPTLIKTGNAVNIVDSVQDINTVDDNSINESNVEVLPVYTMEPNDVMDIKKALQDLKTNFSELNKSVLEYQIKTNIALDKMFSLLQVKKCSHNEDISKEKIEPNFLEMFNFPLQTAEEIDNLNKSLQIHNVFRHQITAFLQTIGGTSGTMDGVKIAYKLVDILFVPDCLLEYSWTGISRDKEVRKKPFQKYEAIIDIFFNVLKTADNRFTKEKTISIFRDKILKHAKTRSLRKKPMAKQDQVINENKSVEADETQETESQEKNSRVEVDASEIIQEV